jgi:aerobic carbon-monoxide dehydrogenase medium subunit
VKPPRFEYIQPDSVDAVVALLAEHGEDAKLIAGGQSLVPMLNMRLVRPAVLIDLARVPGLSYIREEDGYLAVGAMTRQRDVERSELVARRCPLLHEAVQHIAHPQIRNRGTVGGSLAHHDPSAELCAVATALDATFVIRGPGGTRTSGPSDFFVMYFTVALEPGELLTEVRFPVTPPRTGQAFLEVARRSGDFALVGVASSLTLSAGGSIAEARIALTGVGPAPVRALAAEDLLAGQSPSPELWAKAGEAAAADLEPDSDIHATSEYRKQLARVLTARALGTASVRALMGGDRA